MSTDRYFQFPLSLLAFGADEKTRLTTIMDYCIVFAGHRMCEKIPSEERLKIVEEFSSESLPIRIRKDRSSHQEVIVGMHVLKIRGGNVETILNSFDAASSFDLQTARVGGSPSPSVRIASDYLWDVFKGIGMTYREFAVLCAVHSVIGRKPYVRITRDRIRAASLGYKSRKVLFDGAGQLTDAGMAKLVQRSDGTRPLTIDQVRYTLDCLESRGCFARVHVSRRQTFFSNRLTKEELREMLFKRKTRRAFELKQAREADRELQRRIATTNQENSRPAVTSNPHYNKTPTIIAEGNSPGPRNEQSTIPHAVPTEPPPSPHYNKNVPNKNDLTETDLTKTEDLASAVKETESSTKVAVVVKQKAPVPTFTPPSLEDVQTFFASLFKNVDGECAAKWFSDHGSEDWTVKDWKGRAVSWLANERDRKRRDQRLKSLHPEDGALP